MGYACERLHVPPAEAYGVATFYALFSVVERAPVVAHVCDDVACHAAGAETITKQLHDRLGPAGETRDGATWLRSPCLGLCERAPAAMLTVAGPRATEGAWGNTDANAICAALTSRTAPVPARALVPQVSDASATTNTSSTTIASKSSTTTASTSSTTNSTTTPSSSAPAFGDAGPLRLLARVGRVDPTSASAYRAAGGYEALRLALERGPAAVIRDVTDSGLVGRGGAAFPTGRKWQAVASAGARPKYLVCNADESEPGTFKDRVIMEEDPFAVIEAMTIAGVTIGAELGFLYVRGEYPLAHARLEHAIREARANGWLGDDVMGQGVRFDVELRQGAGAYICGEETALFASIEGFRGEPRTKPPFPVEAGLFARPTVVNNVETLVNVPWILRHGPEAYRRAGTTGSPGTRLFCVSGAVSAPGLYELPFGAKLSELLALCGAKRTRTVLLGGAAGTFLAPHEFDVPLTFEDTRKIGATLGSGVVLVLDDSVSIPRVLERIASFFRDESCGQCIPCRVGTVRQEELVQRLSHGKPCGSHATERVLLRDLGQVMRDASICGLGQTASSAIESAVAKLDPWNTSTATDTRSPTANGPRGGGHAS